MSHSRAQQLTFNITNASPPFGHDAEERRAYAVAAATIIVDSMVSSGKSYDSDDISTIADNIQEALKI